MVESEGLQNPFLDPYAPPEGGKMGQLGQPLSRLQIPVIPTLISRSPPTIDEIMEVSLEPAMGTPGLTPNRPIMVAEEDIGIEINLNVTGEGAFTPVGKVNPSQVSQTQTGRKIPQNYEEAREVLALITSQRAGSKNVAFSNAEIKTIAKNLNLSPSGNKDVVVNRIQTAVRSYFNMT